MAASTVSIERNSADRLNVRRPDVMTAVQAQVEAHYRSEIVEKLRAAGGSVSCGDMTVRLAKEFGFCYGVERAIDLAYAASKVFSDRRLYILGEIIHNPEVNEQLRGLGIKNLIGHQKDADMDELQPDDVVIVPAFGSDVATIERLNARGCQIVDTTCGDVMNVWKRVRQYASDGVTSIIHGSAQHEETRATSSRATGDGGAHYLVVRTLAETDYVCDYIQRGGSKADFLAKFKDSHSVGFDPDLHLQKIGVANQTTMLRGETEEVQRRLRAAIAIRDGERSAEANFRVFDTICGATQERQDALHRLLEEKLDLLLVVGGYNSSNTTHLVEIGAARLPTYFIRNGSRLESPTRIVHYDLARKCECATEGWLPNGSVTVGITAGASCPNNLIEDTVLRLFTFRGVSQGELLEL